MARHRDAGVGDETFPESLAQLKRHGYYISPIHTKNVTLLYDSVFEAVRRLVPGDADKLLLVLHGVPNSVARTGHTSLPLQAR